MDFIQETKEKVASAKMFFSKLSRPMFTMAVTASAVFLPSCETTTSNVGAYTRYSRSVTTTYQLPNGGKQTVTENSAYNVREAAQARRENARAFENLMQGLREGAKAADSWRNVFDGR